MTRQRNGRRKFSNASQNPGDGTPYLFLGKIHYEAGELG